MIDQNTAILHLRRIREYFSRLPPLRPETVDIVLRAHLNVPEALMERAREEVELLNNPEQVEVRKAG